MIQALILFVRVTLLRQRLLPDRLKKRLLTTKDTPRLAACRTLLSLSAKTAFQVPEHDDQPFGARLAPVTLTKGKQRAELSALTDR